ncbi:alpha/beta hydrolase [Nonomuraea ferruginea]
MTPRDLIDPESRGPLDALLDMLPGGFNTIPDIVQRRAVVSGLLGAMEVPDNPNVVKEDRTIPGPDGEPDIAVRIYRPADAAGQLPGVYYIHGGGMILGDIAGEDATATMICDRVGAVVVSVEYRLAPRASASRAGRGLLRRPGVDREERRRPGPGPRAAGPLRRQRRRRAGHRHGAAGT